MDSRFRQAHKEAFWSLILTITYLVVWVITAHFAGNQAGVTGLPRWFELSCLFVPGLFILLCWAMVHFVFRDISLEQPDEK